MCGNKQTSLDQRYHLRSSHFGSNIIRRLYPELLYCNSGPTDRIDTFWILLEFLIHQRPTANLIYHNQQVTLTARLTSFLVTPHAFSSLRGCSSCCFSTSVVDLELLLFHDCSSPEPKQTKQRAPVRYVPARM